MFLVSLSRHGSCEDGMGHPDLNRLRCSPQGPCPGRALEVGVGRPALPPQVMGMRTTPTSISTSRGRALPVTPEHQVGLPWHPSIQTRNRSDLRPCPQRCPCPGRESNSATISGAASCLCSWLQKCSKPFCDPHQQETLGPGPRASALQPRAAG